MIISNQPLIRITKNMAPLILRRENGKQCVQKMENSTLQNFVPPEFVLHQAEAECLMSFYLVFFVIKTRV